MLVKSACKKKRLGAAKLTCLFFLLSVSSAGAQVCVDDYFNVNLTTATVQNEVAIISAPENEVLAAGNVFRYNSLLQGGWLTQFSAQGTVLWTRQYYTGAFNFLNFTNVISADNESYLVTGNIGDVDTTTWPLTHLTEYGFLLKIDKYGNVIWSKRLSNLISPFATSNINSIEKTKDGSFILTVSYFNFRQYTVVMKMTQDGDVIWTSLMSSPSRNDGFGDAKVKILNSGDIVFGGTANIVGDNTSYQRKGYYFACLDGTTGTQLWKRLFLGWDTLSLGQATTAEIINITELPDNSLSFITSYANRTIQGGLRKTDKVLNFITDASGILKKVISYSSEFPPLYASSASDAGNGNRTILMDNGDVPSLMRIDAQGDIVWQKAYALIRRGQATKTVLTTAFGNYFFCSTDNGGSTDPKLIKTDNDGNMPCVESTFPITMTDATPDFFMQPLNVNFESGVAGFDSRIQVGAYNYIMQSEATCRKACCNDVTDTADEVRLCNLPFYVLANNDTVRNSGLYPVKYKTTKGCDSIVYYNVVLNFTPSAKLGADTCLGEKDSLVLKAVPGYNTYIWNGISTASSKYVVRQPGDYVLQIENECGMQSDTVKILQQCAFDIFMPNAFTPNGDGRNDLFRVPPQNYNRLISFTVFNRWGQKIFETKNISEGWNGMNREYPAAAGTYIYIIVMKSLDDKTTFTKKGWVTLIR
jgi:gliding motility-associated-like protein